MMKYFLLFLMNLVVNINIIHVGPFTEREMDEILAALENREKCDPKPTLKEVALSLCDVFTNRSVRQIRDKMYKLSKLRMAGKVFWKHYFFRLSIAAELNV